MNSEGWSFPAQNTLRDLQGSWKPKGVYHSHLKVLYVLQKAIQLVTPAALFLCHSIPVCVSWVLLICEHEVICLAPL